MAARVHTRLALLLTSAAMAQGQYYYSDSFASYNSGAWSYPTSSGLVFSGSGLSGAGTDSITSLIALNNGGLAGRQEIKATANSFPSSFNWVTLDLWLGANSTATSGFKVGFRASSHSVYQVSGGSTYELASYGFSASAGQPIRAILAASGVRVVIGSNQSWTPVSGFSGSQGVGFSGYDSGHAITQAQLAAGDTTAPNNVTGLSGQGAPGEVTLQWTAASDNAGGSGLFRYNIYRNSTYLASTYNANYIDNAVSPGTSYTYVVKSEDYHANESSGVSVAVSTGLYSSVADPALPRRTGVRALGSYWGAAGENIDTRSGNVNFLLPLLKAVGRGATSIGLGLSYNSQNWRLQGGFNHRVGYDVGYGFGWKLQAGSIFQVNDGVGGPISHYVFTDGTGAEYRLDVNDGGIWWSKEGMYVAYDPGTARVRFMDGTFWEMSCLSGGSEQDKGTRYPTKIQDSNGNFITLEYKPAAGLGGVNSSARISTIKDIRSTPGNAYTFTYTSDYLMSISTSLATGENYSFSYSGAVSPASPIAGGAGGPWPNVKMLQSVTQTGPNLTHSFTYDVGGTANAGELTKVVFPYLGELRWSYTDSQAYSNGQKLREVNYRYLVKQSGASPTTYTITYDSGGQPFHFWSKVKDPNGVSEKTWWFGFGPTDLTFPWAGLALYQQETLQSGATPPRSTQLFWAQEATHQSLYLTKTETKIDPATAYEKLVKNEQLLDYKGNLQWTKSYDFSGSLRSTTNFTYKTGTEYTNRFILNRQTSAVTTFAAGGGTTVNMEYDNYPGGTLTNRTGLDLHDSANYGQYVTARGNATGGGIGYGYYATKAYDITGFATGSTNGSTTTAATPDSKNVVATALTPNGDATKAMYAGFNSTYQLTSVSGPNGTSTSMTYDPNARPASTTNPHGEFTSYTYDDANRVKTATTGTRWAKTYFDGFGRAIREEAGYSSTTVSKVDTEYDSCGCSPLGKVKRVSRPYTGGSPSAWTTYNYDSQGRVTSVVAADGASTTSYLYQGNRTKVTSPTGKWKWHEMDVAGNLLKVTEPNPAGGADLETTYTYNDKGLLLTVSMPRGGTTQTRTFTYDANGKVLTAANPETGTVTNTYDSTTGLLTQKVDAKNNKVSYTYDTYKRVTEIKRYEWVSGAWVERTEQATKFYYDSNPDGTFTANNLAGRLAYVETFSKRGGAAWNAPGGGSAWETLTFREMYSYDTAGLMTAKRLRVSGKYSPSYSVASDYLESTYSYTSGRMTGQTYPSAHDWLGSTEITGPSFSYGFDSMARPHTMTGYIDGVTYNAAGQPTAITTSNGQVNAEARVYNTLGQLTSLTTGNQKFEYDFSATQNDGRITAQRTYVGGTLQETISYGYDSLNRLTSANGGSWTAAYGYDGFGNLLSVTPTGSGPSSLGVTVNATNNRVTGWTYDTNGNVTAMPSFTGSYDIENRLLEASKNNAVLYGYGADNRRIFESKRGSVHSNGDDIEEFVTFWSGQRIGRYKIRWDASPNTFVFTRLEENVYFGPKPIRLGNPSAPETNVAVDRLGSVRRGNKDYFPYGQENPTTTAGDKEKYATYKHDAATDLSYADQRYYATGAGRFMSADPYEASAGMTEPGSWNRYAYVHGDPINFADSSGLWRCRVTGGTFDFDEYYNAKYTAQATCQSRYNPVWLSVDVTHLGRKAQVAADVESYLNDNYRYEGTRQYVLDSDAYRGQAYENFDAAWRSLSDGQLSSNCQSVLTRMGVSQQDVTRQLNSLRRLDASLATNTSIAAATGAGDQRTSVAYYFEHGTGEDGEQITFPTSLAGIRNNVIYLDAREWAARSPLSAQAGLLHETLHFLGVSHATMAIALNISVGLNDSEAISQKLLTECW